MPSAETLERSSTPADNAEAGTSNGTVNSMRFAVMLAAALTVVSADASASPSKNPYQPAPWNALDALKAFEQKEDLAPLAELLEKAHNLAELRAKQRRVVKLVIDDYLENFDNPKAGHDHFHAFDALAEYGEGDHKGNLPALLEVLEGYRIGAYRQKANATKWRQKIEWALKNVTMTQREEFNLREQWREATKKEQDELSRATPARRPSTTPPPPAIAPTDKSWYDLELHPPQVPPMAVPKKQSSLQRNNQPWKDRSAAERIYAQHL